MVEIEKNYRKIEISQYTQGQPGQRRIGEAVSINVRTKSEDGEIPTSLGKLSVKRQEKPPGYLLRGRPVGTKLRAPEEEAIFAPDKPNPTSNERKSQVRLASGRLVTIFDSK